MYKWSIANTFTPLEVATFYVREHVLRGVIFKQVFNTFAVLLIVYRKFHKIKNWKKSLNPHQLKIISHIQNNNGTSSYKDLYGLYPSNLSHETLKGKLRRDIKRIEEQYFKYFKKAYFSYKVDPLDKRLKLISIK